ncbi:MAG: ribonuclease PH [Gemmatimonadota bacterium]|nr:ribonuclease PH [Gemmatimonadaceae bacterium]MDQ3518703.1 ribonuclease PH [Gemmatimonadota bacterium]
MAENSSSRTGRTSSELRAVTLERGAAPFAEGSCLSSFGATRVLCTASVETGVPGWRRGSGQGWLTAEYAMLPRATKTRSARERAQLGGRTQEIQRLIGRSVRAMLDDFSFGEFTVKLDCDVLVADGGTRTAAITGAAVAIVDAFDWMVANGKIASTPVRRRVAAISVGIVDGEPRLDLDYPEDVRAEVDMNVVMSSGTQFVEVQGTGEHGTFDREQLHSLLDLAVAGIARLDAFQQVALGR